jgi:3-dehydroquinate dehydratase-2
MTKSKHILVLNGPNINMLGTREPDIYGHVTMADIVTGCADRCAKAGLSMDSFHSNCEGELITQIQKASETFDWIVINAAGLTHTSVALRDALALFAGDVIEVHVSNVHARESFRHVSLISAIAKGVVAGFGAQSYYMAINFIADTLTES